jgi:hypothetical protein
MNEELNFNSARPDVMDGGIDCDFRKAALSIVDGESRSVPRQLRPVETTANRERQMQNPSRPRRWCRDYDLRELRRRERSVARELETAHFEVATLARNVLSGRRARGEK